MSRNLECKARLRSIGEGERVARSIGATNVSTLVQRDTFLHGPPGRLKMREQRGIVPELIYYERPDLGGTAGTWSTYLIVPVASARSVIKHFRGGIVTVEKTRKLYIFRNARIHLDDVSGLGTFVEFEVVTRGRHRRDRALFARLVKAFGLTRGDFVRKAYADLLLSLRRA